MFSLHYHDLSSYKYIFLLHILFWIKMEYIFSLFWILCVFKNMMYIMVPYSQSPMYTIKLPRAGDDGRCVIVSHRPQSRLLTSHIHAYCLIEIPFLKHVPYCHNNTWWGPQRSTVNCQWTLNCSVMRMLL